MAELVKDFLSEGVVETFRGLCEAIAEASEQTIAWLREIARPPPNVRLVSDDGTSFTGIVLAERSDVVVMLAARHPPDAPTPPRRPTPAESKSVRLAERLDPASPHWDQDVDPYQQ